MSINLEQERKNLEMLINALEMQIATLQKDLTPLRERLSHIIALLPEGQKQNIPQQSKLSKRPWAELCRTHNPPLSVGGDSAHRVLRREDTQLHNSIPHMCEYDGRKYP